MKALRGFLGLTSYNRKFIRNYGLIAAPLTYLLKKDSFRWTAKADSAFHHLNVAVMHPHVLALLDFSKTFVIKCDASGVGIGAVLMQRQRPIVFHNQALTGRSLHLSIYDKEFLALIIAVKRWRPYLLGKPFIIKTDHWSLKFLLDQKMGTPAQ